MANEPKPGTYEARVCDYGVGKTKKGDPMAMIRFEYQDEEMSTHQINWYGTFVNEKASEITCEALAVCGWSTNNPADLAKGAGSGVLAEDQVVQITLKAEEYEGKTRVKVAYVNPPGGAGFRDSMDHAEAVKAFQGLNIGGIAAAARKKNAPKAPPNYAPGASSVPPEMNTSERIPF